MPLAKSDACLARPVVASPVGSSKISYEDGSAAEVEALKAKKFFRHLLVLNI